MKHLLLFLAFLHLPYIANAQSELWGDINNDGTVTTADIMKLVDIVLLGHPDMTVSPSTVTLLPGATTEVTITNGSGLFEVTSLKPEVVQTSFQGRTITLTAISGGQTMVQIKDTYTKKYVEIPVVVNNSPLLLSNNELVLSIGEQKTVEITSGNGNYTVDSSNAKIATASIHGNTISLTAVATGSAKISVVDVISGQSADIDVTVSTSFIICPDDHHPHMIDLGLPSKTKWACCNVDTDHPEKQCPSNDGGYYAWGETETQKVSNAYQWATYTYTSEQGMIDIGDDISGTVYDVAHVKWGGSWVMPSFAQIQELLDNCNHEFASVNGSLGVKFTAQNGNCIFLPAAGFMWVGDLYDGRCAYWSSTLSQEIREAYILFTYLDHDFFKNAKEERSHGLSVRPVAK